MPAHWYVQALASVVALDPRNHKFQATTDPFTRHFLALALWGVKRQRVKPEYLAPVLHSKPRRQVIQDIWNFDPGRAMAKLLSRLGARQLAGPGYTALVRVLADPQRRARALDVHASTIRFMIPRLAAEPIKELVVLDGVLLDREQQWQLRRFDSIAPEASPAMRMAFLRRQRKTDGDKAIVDALAQRKAPLPPPIWAGDETIKPIETVAEMVSIGRQLSNCLGESYMVQRAMQVTSCFYLHHTWRVAIEVERDPLSGLWSIVNMELAHNANPSSEQRREIECAFRKQEIGSQLHYPAMRRLRARADFGFVAPEIEGEEDYA